MHANYTHSAAPKSTPSCWAAVSFVRGISGLALIFGALALVASPNLLAQSASATQLGAQSGAQSGTQLGAQNASNYPKTDDSLSQWLSTRGLASSVSATTHTTSPTSALPISAQNAPAPQTGFTAQLGDFFNPFLNRSEALTAKATDLLNRAAHFLGVPYKRGGIDESTGFDCSGFVQNLFKTSTGLLLPRTAAEQARSTEQIPKTELVAGDLVFFNTLKRAFSHVGIYVGDGKFVHAPRPGAQVRVENMNLPYWITRFNGARRVGALHDDSAISQ